MVLVSLRYHYLHKCPPTRLLPQMSTQNLWDCGGQEGFLNNYVSSQRTQIFTNVAILIYVFDGNTPSGSQEWEKDIRYYEECLTSLRENSDDANVWVLVNKMDLVSRDRTERDRIFEDKRAELEKRSNAVMEDGKEAKGIRCFATSIYDESLYKVRFCLRFLSEMAGMMKFVPPSLLPTSSTGLVISHTHPRT